MEFTSPTKGAGNDWVLVIDDTTKGYKSPDKLEPDLLRLFLTKVMGCRLPAFKGVKNCFTRNMHLRNK